MSFTRPKKGASALALFPVSHFEQQLSPAANQNHLSCLLSFRFHLVFLQSLITSTHAHSHTKETVWLKRVAAALWAAAPMLQHDVCMCAPHTYANITILVICIGFFSSLIFGFSQLVLFVTLKKSKKERFLFHFWLKATLLERLCESVCVCVCVVVMCSLERTYNSDPTPAIVSPIATPAKWQPPVPPEVGFARSRPESIGVDRNRIPTDSTDKMGTFYLSIISLQRYIPMLKMNVL